MKKRVDDLFNIDVILGDAQTEELLNNSYFSPQIDIYENKKGIFIEIELPGVLNEDIKVFLNNNKLFITGIKRCNDRDSKVKYYLLERPYGLFKKILEIPPHINANSIEAHFKDGVLIISMRYKDKRELKID